MLIMNNIRVSRQEKGLTQEELANELYISARQTVGKWERGEDGGITLQQLRGLCNLFNCEIGYIVGDYDTKRKATADASEETGLSNASVLSLSSNLKARPYIPLLDFLLSDSNDDDDKDKETGIHFLQLLSEYFYSIDSDTREDAISLLEIQNTMNKLKTKIKKRLEKRLPKQKKLF